MPEHIGRHAHPKAPPEAQPEPVTPTGIDFIALLDQAHQAETAGRLHLSHLADPPTGDTASVSQQTHAHHASAEEGPR